MRQPWDNAIPLGYYSGKMIPPYTHSALGWSQATVEVHSPSGTLSGGASYSVHLMTSNNGVDYTDTSSDPISNATDSASGTVDVPPSRYLKVRIECSSGEHLLAGTLVPAW